jgi:hypothetical protein
MQETGRIGWMVRGRSTFVDTAVSGRPSNLGIQLLDFLRAHPSRKLSNQLRRLERVTYYDDDEPVLTPDVHERYRHLVPSFSPSSEKSDEENALEFADALEESLNGDLNKILEEGVVVSSISDEADWRYLMDFDENILSVTGKAAATFSLTDLPSDDDFIDDLE